jgi:hypothetical protein
MHWLPGETDGPTAYGQGLHARADQLYLSVEQTTAGGEATNMNGPAAFCALVCLLFGDIGAFCFCILIAIFTGED